MVYGNILVVNNSETYFESIANAFSKINTQAKLCYAKNDTEAWLMLQGHDKLSPSPKIMLIDINADGIHGIDLITKIRSNLKLRSMLIFVITSVNNSENKHAALNLNIAGYMNKPFEKVDMFSFFSVLNDYWNCIEFSS